LRICYTLITRFTRPSPTAIYTLSLHDALPILGEEVRKEQRVHVDRLVAAAAGVDERVGGGGDGDEVGRDQPGALVDQLVEGVLRSEEHTSELQSRENLVCRLLLEKKKHQLTT